MSLPTLVRPDEQAVAGSCVQCVGVGRVVLVLQDVLAGTRC